MRTKNTARLSSTSLKKAAAAAASAAAAAAPTASREAERNPLSDREREELLAWLSDNAHPFTVRAAPLSLKRKRGQTQQPQLTVLDDLYDARLSVQYTVEPRTKWARLRKYKRFTVMDQSFAVGDCILVKHDDGDDAQINFDLQWKARVIDVKALDSEHVYVVVAWLNRPEDLSSGRRPWHGKRELIPSNQLDVIDAMSVNGNFKLVHWDDTTDQSLSVGEDEYFWRQTIDSVSKGGLSKLKRICVDNEPQNPEELIVQCTADNCRTWLHVRCIAKQAVEDAASSAKEPGRKSSGGAPQAEHRAHPRAQAEAILGDFAATVFVAGVPGSESAAVPNGKDATARAASEKSDEQPDTDGVHAKSNAVFESEVVITDANGHQRSSKLRCLACGNVIEDN